MSDITKYASSTPFNLGANRYILSRKGSSVAASPGSAADVLETLVWECARGGSTNFIFAFQSRVYRRGTTGTISSTGLWASQIAYASNASTGVTSKTSTAGGVYIFAMDASGKDIAINVTAASTASGQPRGMFRYVRG